MLLDITLFKLTICSLEGMLYSGPAMFGFCGERLKLSPRSWPLAV